MLRCVAYKKSQYSQGVLVLACWHVCYVDIRRVREQLWIRRPNEVNVLRHVINSLDIWRMELSLKLYFIQESIVVVRGDNETPIGYWVLDKHRLKYTTMRFDSRCMSLFYISFKTLWWLEWFFQASCNSIFGCNLIFWRFLLLKQCKVQSCNLIFG